MATEATEYTVGCWLLFCPWRHAFAADDVLTERQQGFIRDQHVRTAHTEEEIRTEIGFIGEEVEQFGHLEGIAERVPMLRHRRENLLRLIGMPGRRPWRPSDGDSRCQWCGGWNPTWYVDSHVWNAVMGSGPLREAPGVLCPTCFLIQAQAKEIGATGAWEVRLPMPRSVPESVSESVPGAEG
jgi:hypothetical protein